MIIPFALGFLFLVFGQRIPFFRHDGCKLGGIQGGRHTRCSPRPYFASMGQPDGVWSGPSPGISPTPIPPPRFGLLNLSSVQSEQAGLFLASIFRFAPRKAIDGDTSVVVSRLLPYAISAGNLDVAAVADELANSAQDALRLCLPSTESVPSLSPLHNVCSC